MNFTQGLKYFVVILLLTVSVNAFAHVTDTTKVQGDKVSPTEVAIGDTIYKRKPHSPMVASTLSAILPGAGQVFNRKIWKVPIIYAGLGATLYFAFTNLQDYKSFRSAYVLRKSGGVDPYLESHPTDVELLAAVEQTHKFYEMAFIGTALVYVLNIIDASVDAHLFYFDVSDDLSINIQPQVLPSHNYKTATFGSTISLRF